jgi:hypothetical protein
MELMAIILKVPDGVSGNLGPFGEFVLGQFQAATGGATLLRRQLWQSGYSCVGEPGRPPPDHPIPVGTMPLHTPLVTIIVVGLGLAFLLGALANRLHLSLLVG